MKIDKINAKKSYIMGVILQKLNKEDKSKLCSWFRKGCSFRENHKGVIYYLDILFKEIIELQEKIAIPISIENNMIAEQKSKNMIETTIKLLNEIVRVFRKFTAVYIGKEVIERFKILIDCLLFWKQIFLTENLKIEQKIYDDENFLNRLIRVFSDIDPGGLDSEYHYLYGLFFQDI
eukprot:UN31446